ncbi:putative cis-3-chloroacrylic acid protein [Venturia nashicola]|uniref:Putative cis-3-chloroacrylic acid protein n=1 Tax=Venturia nashicola TaxID=86259 RepID=A0A4Z1PQ19_9PEZI|nr:putative cis-3-chloroacrylic acid protein [Venturia nashicola]TLD38130.1 putative cis-3-chloroacrylic acid protein [Venturia nashicola]
MPLYTITHTTPLSSTKKDKLASALTTLHATKFTTPKMFVNVRFVNADHSRIDTYVAGKSTEGKDNNYLEAHVRAGAERPKELFDELAEEMVKIWEDVVHHDSIRVFIYGSILSGHEYGFPIPAAGKDQEWMRQNLSAFESRADEGDEVMQDLVAEIKERKLLD